MQILRAPDSASNAVDALADYPSERRWVEIPAGDGQSLRVHLVDTNPDDALPVVVMLHGNPSWSYIWRNQIAPLVEAGYRVIAPDLVGMGLSDTPSELDDYTVERHVEWMRALLVDELALTNADMVLHDWGGIIGLRLAAENPGLVNRMVISNTGLPDPDPAEPSEAGPEQWACPLNLGSIEDVTLSARLLSEVGRLKTWPSQTGKARGRTLFDDTVLGETLLAMSDRLTEAEAEDPMAGLVRGLLIPEGRYRGGSAF